MKDIQPSTDALDKACADAVAAERMRCLGILTAFLSDCVDAANTLEDVIQYKSEHLVKKHGDAESLADFKAAIQRVTTRMNGE